MADETYDVIVIGSGPGGYVSAIRGAQLGLKTALVERDPFLGGTCLHRECIPTKALLHSASVFDQIKKAAKFGIIAKEVSLDFTLVQADKERIVDKQAKGIQFLMKKNKVTVFTGTGGLAGPGAVSVTSSDGKTQTLKTKNVVLATGSVPRMLPGMDVVAGRVVTSDELLTMEAIPSSLAVLGGGAVGVEFASVFARYGSQVTLVEMLPRLVPLEDEDCSKELERSFRKQGINVLVDHKASDFKVEKGSGYHGKDVRGVTFNATSSSGTVTPIKVETLLVAVGRGPVTNIPGLETTKIVLDRGYLQVDESMRTAEPNVFAIGDCAMLPSGKHAQLAHVASAEGIFVMEQIAGKDVGPINYDQVPNCTYCDPEVASVGLSEAEALRRGYKVKAAKFPFSAIGKAAIEHQTEGFVKIVSEEKYDELLGVHIVGPRATDLIAEACVALRLESTTEELFRTIHAHPTLSEAIGEAAHLVNGHAIHI